MREIREKITPSLNTCAIWSVMALLAAADAAGLKAEGIHFSLEAFLPKVFAVVTLVVFSLICMWSGRRPRLAVTLHMAAAAFAFTVVIYVSSYLTPGWHRALIDNNLVAVDRALGFDWPATYRWIIAHPLVGLVLYGAYQLPMLQIIFLLSVLNFREQHTRGWEMVWLFVVLGLVYILASALWPAVGAYGYYHIEYDTPYVRVFTALYNGTLKDIGDKPLEGIIQFPSFHVAIAILIPYAARGIPRVFPFLVALNILSFLAAPIIGGHHFADLLGGIVLTVITLLIFRRLNLVEKGLGFNSPLSSISPDNPPASA